MLRHRGVHGGNLGAATNERSLADTQRVKHIGVKRSDGRGLGRQTFRTLAQLGVLDLHHGRFEVNALELRLVDKCVELVLGRLAHTLVGMHLTHDCGSLCSLLGHAQVETFQTTRVPCVCRQTRFADNFGSDNGRQVGAAYHISPEALRQRFAGFAVRFTDAPQFFVQLTLAGTGLSGLLAHTGVALTQLFIQRAIDKLLVIGELVVLLTHALVFKAQYSCIGISKLPADEG